MFFFALSTSCLYWEVLRVMCSLHFCLNKRITIFWLFFGVSTTSLFWEKFCQRHCEYFLCAGAKKIFWSYFALAASCWQRLVWDIIIPFILEYVFLEKYYCPLICVSKKTFSFQLILARGFLYKVAIRSLWQKSPWCFILREKALVTWDE